MTNTHADKDPDRTRPAAHQSERNSEDIQFDSRNHPSGEGRRSEGPLTLPAVPAFGGGSAAAQLKSGGKADTPNQTGMPDQLKDGIESLSGETMDDVRVKYNSDKPAQLNAHAYAQGTEIHLASGQEKHLPHEAWHVVQQKQGRVKPTVQMKSETGGGGEPVAQLVNKEIGKINNTGRHPDGIMDQMKVITEIGSGNTFTWPTDAVNTYFNVQNYSGSVTKAMDWGAGGGEGTAGWYTRQYNPQEFHNIAVEASTAISGINSPALDQDSNKTLIAIRAFRGADGANMGAQTLADLQQIETTLNNTRPALAASNMINLATDAPTEIKADPAEAHPNTLPTAKVTFPGGRTLYFKGRDGSVENALVGSAVSAARSVSALGSAATTTAASEVGTHSFVSNGLQHMAGDVGPAVAPAIIGPEEIRAGWVSAARTAAITSLTGTGDLHDSNVIDGRSATKHIIDAEFLLDSTAWNTYATASAANEIPNFNIQSMVPAWLKAQTHTMSVMDKLALGDEVAQRFRTMNLDTDGALETILAPIRAVVAADSLLRISPDPFVTAFWLTSISQYHEAQDKNAEIQGIWDFMTQVYADNYHIDLTDRVAGVAGLRQNFHEGKVPLFHISSLTQAFFLNKNTVIGAIRDDRSSARFIELTKAAMINGYANMVMRIRAAIMEA
ncbi:DUF4157 domain-containing protein [Daejeonella sp. JGW-45]|uniref:eCIS core domain-containing protein n=1 Tax=Daejeonella sp. JGW-45 TaxID=3034148 RepID=UPI0023ED037A|nr:DUF4157 domain-containing protein [Daejeonella sp. JGW-45]